MAARTHSYSVKSPFQHADQAPFSLNARRLALAFPARRALAVDAAAVEFAAAQVSSKKACCRHKNQLANDTNSTRRFQLSRLFLEITQISPWNYNLANSVW